MKARIYRGRRFYACAAFVASTLLASGAASATGFFINQQSVKGLGRVDAGNTAAADELGTLFFNPAGMSQLWERENGFARFGAHSMLSIGGHYVIGRTKLGDSGSTASTLAGTGGVAVPSGGGGSRNPVDPTLIPNVYFAHQFNERVSVGIAANAPFGLATEFHPEWFGRYDAIEASLRTMNISVVGALKLSDSLSIGGGVDAQRARTTLSSAIPNPLGAPSAATDARVSTKGHDWSPGFNVGVLYKLSSSTQVGAHYRSGMTHEIHGASTFSGFSGPLALLNTTVGSRATLHLPAIATVGVRQALTANLALLAELEWYNWSKFKEIRLRFDTGLPDAVRATNYRDTWAVAVGAEYVMPRTWLMPGQWTYRGGIQLDRTPTVDAFRDTTVPDANRLWLGVGASYRQSSTLTFDLAFNHVFFENTNVSVTRDLGLGSSATIRGTATNVVNTIAVDARWAF